MKKIQILFACLVAVLAFSSCEEDTYPRLGQIEPYQEFLNTPATASQYIELTPEGTVNLTCSQPNYGGMSLAVNYAVQVSLAKDFTSVATNENDGDAAPAYIELSTKYTSANMQVLSSELAEAICSLRGIQSEEGYTDEPARPVYIRLRAYVPQDEAETTVMSNIVKLDNVKGYYALRLPGYIWLVGLPNNWAINGDDNWKLYEAIVDSDVYYGTFEIPAGQFQFRFYAQPGDWESWSIGAQDADAAVDVAMTNGVYTGKLYASEGGGDKKGKGNWNIANWAGGTVQITVDLKAKKVEFRQVDL